VWELFTQGGPVGACACGLKLLQHPRARPRCHMLMPPHLLLSYADAAVNVYMPKDRVTNAHQGYGFVEFRGEEDADYVSRCA
jgi:RNA recognition motif-containing protein